MPSFYGTFYNTKLQPVSPHGSTTVSRGTCPVARHAPGGTHEYREPNFAEGHVRSVCPALNAMANHGYLPRDGQNITFTTLFCGLKACYGLSTPLAFLLTLGGFLIIRRFPVQLPFGLGNKLRVHDVDGCRSVQGAIDLHHINLHGGVEHDASLVHVDVKKGQLYPPIFIREDWLTHLVGDISPEVRGYSRSSSPSPPEILVHHPDSDNEDSGMRTLAPTRAHSRASSITLASDCGSGWRLFTSDRYQNTLVDAADVGRMRARRQMEIQPKVLDGIHAEIARGEMAIILGVWEQTNGTKKGAPLPDLLNWLGTEQLPESWEPTHTEGLIDVFFRSRKIQAVAEEIEKTSL
ncbi:hypothetical protein PM082_008638 [Marasmius tenuissimus]|nr:hypothetical protein PM082_008638 [Marasmius tenuissimus]